MTPEPTVDRYELALCRHCRHVIARLPGRSWAHLTLWLRRDAPTYGATFLNRCQSDVPVYGYDAMPDDGAPCTCQMCAAHVALDAGWRPPDPTGDAVIAAALEQHHPTTAEALPYGCYNGDCDEHDDECPTVELLVCAGCWALASEINDEYIPNEVLATNCPVCVAVAAYREATPS